MKTQVNEEKNTANESVAPPSPARDWLQYAVYEAGRHLDCEIAEKVLGWEIQWAGDKPFHHWEPDDGRTSMWNDLLPSFSTDIRDAMQVVDRLTEGHMITLVHIAKLNEAKTWIVSLSTNGPGFIGREAEAETLPLAICRAALMACRGVPFPSWMLLEPAVLPSASPRNQQKVVD